MQRTVKGKEKSEKGRDGKGSEAKGIRVRAPIAHKRDCAGVEPQLHRMK